MKNSVKKFNTIYSILFIAAFFLQPTANPVKACGTYGTDKYVRSTIKEVTVFLNGAQVHRSGNFYLEKGVSEIIFNEVSPYINRNSIQAKGKGNFTILEVRHHTHYPKPTSVEKVSDEIPESIQKRIRNMEDSLIELGFQHDEIQLLKKTLEIEKNILLTNKLFKGEGKASDSIPLLKDGMAFFREKMYDINKKALALAKREYEVNTYQKQINQRLQLLRQYNQHTAPVPPAVPVQQVIVTVSSKQVVSGVLDISYMVSNAGWSAHYDLRAKNTSSPVQLTYKARVYQQTGENWERVNLKLSTNNPNKGNVKPSLPIWYLDYYATPSPNNSNIRSATTLSNINMPVKRNKAEKIEFKMKENQVVADANTASEYTKLSETISNVEFSIDLPYSIESNGESHWVEVQTAELPSTFYHIVVPKADQEAFVMAKIAGWENMSLLPASATIFFDGTYIGETRINPYQLSDTLQVALGRDASVVVKRRKLTDDTKPQAIGNNLIKTIGFELIVKNKKAADIKLLVEDQIPVTGNPEIKINLEEKGDANYNTETGSLKWNLQLAKGVEQKLNFSYSIKYDKDKSLLGNL